MSAQVMQSITPRELAERLQRGERINLIDVRTPVEYREVHAEIARNVPLDQLNPTDVLAGHDTEEPLYVICRSGNRASKACEAIAAAGFHNVVNIEGGTQAWDAAELPVVRGKKAISLERQVRIVAGLLVLTGALLGYFVNINFIWLSAFIGAGLTFAGITDTCGMGMMLAKMPWNQVKPDPADKECTAEASATSAGGGCCG